MSVTDVRAIRVRAGAKGDWIILQIETGEGLVGLGEMSQSGDDALAVDLALKHFKPKLLGRDTGEVHAIWQELSRDKFNRQTLGMVGNTVLSGIEQALWDLKAKRLGVPVYELFGGKIRDAVKLYANLNRGTTDRSPDGFAAFAARAVADGFQTVKCTPFDDVSHLQRDRHDLYAMIDRGLERVAAVRSAIGPKAGLMVDCHGRFDTGLALTVAKELEQYDLVWFEDPIWCSEDLEGLALVRSKCNMPIAGGEVTFGRKGFWPLLKDRIVDVAMPDVKHCGGIDEARKIAALAETIDVSISPHNPSGPVSTAVSAHLAAVAPNFFMLEYPWGEIDWRRALVRPNEEITNGDLTLPDGPGYGIELDPELLQAHRI